MSQLISKLLIFLGIGFILFFGYLVYLRYSPHPLTFEGQPRTITTLNYETPERLIIPSISVDAPIVPSLIRDNRWETTSKGVSYLASSPVPGDHGNSVIYGHNWKSILGDLPKVKPGQRVTVVWNDKKRKEFIIEYTATVSPDQTYIIDSTDDTRLTIYTCVGFLDSKRFVVVAKPII